MTPERLTIAAAAVAVLVLLVIGLTQLGGGSPSAAPARMSQAQMRARLVGPFRTVSVSTDREVAFVGIDSADSSRASALSFLRSFPLSYPSYFDRSGEAGTTITDSSFTPVTVFYDRRGGQYIHQGPYASAAALERDVTRYALDG